MKNVGCLFFTLLTSMLTVAQTAMKYSLVLKEGEQGVYLFAGSDPTPRPIPAANVYVAEGNKAFRQIGNTGMAATPEAFDQMTGTNALADIAAMKGLADRLAAFEYVKTHTNIKDYGLAAMNIGFLRAMGYCYLDESAKASAAGTQLKYKLEFTGAGSAVEGAIVTGVPPAIGRPLVTETNTSDSSIRLVWQAPVPKGNEALFATVYRQEGNSGTYLKAATLMAAKTKDGKVINYQFYDMVEPGINYDYYIVPQTVTRLAGPVSDTVHAISHDFTQRAGVIFKAVRDTGTGIYLEWLKLKDPQWYAGIIVERKFDTGKLFAAIDTIPATDEVFVDTRVLPGQMYSYRLRMLSITGEALPSPSVHRNALHKSRNARPDPPTGFTARLDANSGVTMLSWKKSDLPFAAGYMVYRMGQQDTVWTLVSNQLYATSFTDTISTFPSGTFKYSVVTLSFEDVKSSYADPAFVTWKNKTANAAVPLGLRGYAVPGRTVLSWRDIRAENAEILGFNLYRRKGAFPEGGFDSRDQLAKAGFEKINTEVLFSSSYTDKTVADGEQYAYLVTALNRDHIEGAPGSSLTLDLPALALPAPAGIGVRKTSAGVVIDWGAAETESVEGYEVYRRSETETEAKLIGKVNKSADSYTDTSGKEDVLYFYTVRSHGRNVSSEMSEEKSIRIEN